MVLSSNDGCVVARSEEVKDKGIPMGIPYFQIKDTLKDIGAVTFSSHLALYRDISKRVFEVVEREVGDIEVYSIDECFFLVDESITLSEIQRLKGQVEMEVGVPITIGVAASKTRAKYVNQVAKRTGGVALWREEEWQEKSSNLPLHQLWGVGASRAKQFAKHDVRTVSDLCKLPVSMVEKRFGVEGLRLRFELLGRSVLSVENKRDVKKSIMSTRSFSGVVTDIDVLKDAIAYHIHQVVKELERMDLVAQNLRILIRPDRYSDFVLEGASLESKFVTPTKSLFALRKEADNLLEKAFKTGVPYKKAGVVLSDLVSSQAVSVPFLIDEEIGRDNERSVLSEVIMSINQRHGGSLVRFGRTAATDTKWRSNKKALSPAYTTSWSGLRTVNT